MEITGHTVEQLLDPTGILEGDRYEFYLNIDVPEDDELYSENGIQLRIILSVIGEEMRIAHYNFIEQVTNQVLDFALEEEEEKMVKDYCANHLD
ncbi:pullulanase [Bacillus sp. IITD106]|nr:pullulanase [Bacillus sp. IITD106]